LGNTWGNLGETWGGSGEKLGGKGPERHYFTLKSRHFTLKNVIKPLRGSIWAYVWASLSYFGGIFELLLCPYKAL
jgi:hypothetical protein